MADALSIDDREARVAQIDNRLGEIDADYDGQLMPDSVREEWNALNAERDDHAATIGELRARRERLVALQSNPAATERATGGAPAVVRSRGNEIYDMARMRAESRSDDEYHARIRDNAHRAIERAQFGAVQGRLSREQAQANVARLLDSVDDDRGTLARRILATGSPEYERWFWAMVAGRGDTVTRPQAALSMGSATSAQLAVPFTLDPTVILTSDGATNPIRAVSRVETITGRAWEGVTSAGITVSRAAEAAAASDNAPSLAQPTVTPTRVQGFVPFSIEADQDWAQLRSEMTRLLTDAKDVEEATSFVTGNGTPPNPGGIQATLTTASNVNDGNTFDVTDLYAAENSLPPRFTPNAVWLARKNFYNSVRALDTNGTLYVRLTAGRPNELIGYTAYEASAMPTRSTTGSRYAILGDFQQFLIVDKAGMDVELIPHLFDVTNNMPTGQRGLYAIWRNNSAILVPNAFRILTWAT
jgi:HK97 family phage major capsid protein